LLPASLANTGDQTLVCQFAEANAAETKLAIHGTGPAAQFATMLEPRRKLRLAIGFSDLGFTGHKNSLLRFAEHLAMPEHA
jgi:hypothetical protein